MQIGTFRASHSVMRAVPRVVNGTVITRTILRARRRPKSYPTLVRRVEPAVLEWINCATDWPDVSVGEARVLIFETPLPNGATFFVRLWSEPRMPLLCEIPSGIQDDALRGALTGMARWRPQQAGMTIEGSAQNFFSRIPIDSELLKGAAAAFVLEMFVDCIGYKGPTPLVATLAHGDRTGSSVH